MAQSVAAKHRKARARSGPPQSRALFARIRAPIARNVVYPQRLDLGEPIESAGVVVGVLGEVTTAKALTDPDARLAADGTILFVAKIPPPSHQQAFSLLVPTRGKAAVRCPQPFYFLANPEHQEMCMAMVDFIQR
ncbi:MAG: hypothetical protein VB934_13570 [Polyangiaceae bacterium]